MPPIRKTARHAPTHKSHILHRHRPVVTMLVGFAIILAIGAAALASSRVRDVIKPETKDNKTPQKISIDTTKWKTYTNPAGTLSFKHPEDWQVTNKAVDKDTVITITGKHKEDGRITIFTSKNSYLGFDGLKQTKGTVAGQSGVIIGETLLGAKKGDTYYTFDGGLSSQTEPYFQEFMKTVELK